MKAPIQPDQVTVLPANEATWADIAAVFGTSDAGRCHCQRFKVMGWIWRDSTQEERTAALRAQTGCDNPAAEATSGLIAYVDGEPAGWAAVEPRTAYPKYRSSQIPWAGRAEDKDDHDIWAVICLLVRKGFRGRGLTYHLAATTVEFARERGARMLEAYPMRTEPGRVITWGDLAVGPYQAFEDAGFTELTHPTTRRYVMRHDLS